jgi:hypothetical protein
MNRFQEAISGLPGSKRNAISPEQPMNRFQKAISGLPGSKRNAISPEQPMTGFKKLLSERSGRDYAKGKKDLPEQYYNMNLTAPEVKSMGVSQAQGLDINVMDASQVKTMKSGGSVVIGKGKDYIKDLL